MVKNNEALKLTKFVRRKSCECSSCGGTKAKMHRGNLILMPSEIDPYFEIKNMSEKSISFSESSEYYSVKSLKYVLKSQFF